MKEIPEGVGLKEAAILVRIGFQRELHLGAQSVLFIRGFLVWMVACSVRSSCVREVTVFRGRMSFQAMSCQVVRECRVVSRADLILSVDSS